jgi:hypothetical protein
VFGKRDVDVWLGELAAYQQITCQCCGAVLTADVLGPAAYTAVPFERICGECYRDCAPEGQPWRHQSRLAAYAAERPGLLVGLLVTCRHGFISMTGTSNVRLAWTAPAWCGLPSAHARELGTRRLISRGLQPARMLR